MTLITLGLGSVFNPHHSLSKGLNNLQALYGPLQTSQVYQSRGVGFSDRFFFNCVTRFECPGDVYSLKKTLKALELSLGTSTQNKIKGWHPLDIDLLLCGNEIITSELFKIPHPDILSQAYVLCPLAEIAPQDRHPILQLSYQHLWNAFDKSKTDIKPVA